VDTQNNRIRRVDPAGVIDTYAGGGSRTDDGPMGVREVTVSLPAAVLTGTGRCT
jgi:hypothetical protein